MIASTQLPEPLTTAVGAFTKYWNSIRPPFACSFDGDASDIHALDFIVYEMGSDFPGGHRAAGLMLGQVFVESGGFDWLVDSDDRLFVGRTNYPRVCLDPIARSVEQENSGVPQYSKFARISGEMLLAGPFVREMLDEEHEAKLHELAALSIDATVEVDVALVCDLLAACKDYLARLAETGG